ncbi:MAG: DUF1501 domain-containing protein, partial [Pirellulales bacterium]
MQDSIMSDLRTTRRALLGKMTTGIGSMALASLLNPPTGHAALPHLPQRASRGGALDPLHFASKAKRVIFLCMAGGMSHLETFDYKPKLAEMHGQPMPDSFTTGQPIAQLQGKQLTCFAPQHPFREEGESGQLISTVFPNLGEVADELCIV